MNRRRYYPTHTPTAPSRLRGYCELCGTWHRSPALRWECGHCGQVYCAEIRPTDMTCPECAGLVEGCEC